MDIKAKISNVIEIVCGGDEVKYFTLEGVEIGGFSGGRKVVPEAPQMTQEAPKGGIVTSPTPKEAKRSKEKNLEKELTLEERVKYEQDKNT